MLPLTYVIYHNHFKWVTTTINNNSKQLPSRACMDFHVNQVLPEAEFEVLSVREGTVGISFTSLWQAEVRIAPGGFTYICISNLVRPRGIPRRADFPGSL